MSGGFPSMNRAAGAVGGWVELGRTTLGSAGDTISVSSLSDKRYYQILCHGISSGNIGSSFRFNSDSGSNYASRYSTDGGTDATQTSGTYGIVYPPDESSSSFQVGYVANLSSNEKLAIVNNCGANDSSAASVAPRRRESVFKWANTSNAINEITANNVAAGDFDTGSELVVLGWDPADTHTNNFWEELASNELGSETTLSSGTFTAKKYLYVEIHTANVASDNQAIYFNSDNSTNYSFRYNNNGGTDGTVTSNNTIQTAIAGGSGTYWSFTNMFIINNTSNEKLVIIHTNENTTTGAANAPARTEVVGKWANTSTQITDIKIADGGGTQNNQQVGSIIKVWGAD